MSNLDQQEAGSPRLAPPSHQDRRQAVECYERAQRLAGTGQQASTIRLACELLMRCCVIDPANLIYRQQLRAVQKTLEHRHKWWNWLMGWPWHLRQRAALNRGDHLKTLEYGEMLLMHDPWNVAVQKRIAVAADSLGLVELAIWTLEELRQHNAHDDQVNQTLARLYEKQGNFAQSQRLQQPAHSSPEGAAEAEVGLPVSLPEAEVATLRERIEVDPTTPDHYLALARCHRENDQLDQAYTTLCEGLAATGNAFGLQMELLDLEIEPFRRNLAVIEEKLKDQPDDPSLQQLHQDWSREIHAREQDIRRQQADRYPGTLGHSHSQKQGE